MNEFQKNGDPLNTCNKRKDISEDIWDELENFYYEDRSPHNDHTYAKSWTEDRSEEEIWAEIDEFLNSPCKNKNRMQYFKPNSDGANNGIAESSEDDLWAELDRYIESPCATKDLKTDSGNDSNNNEKPQRSVEEIWADLFEFVRKKSK